jgi:cation transport protein ChaC
MNAGPHRPAALHWMFGYGSLMWDPGFAHVERRPAVLKGYHREFCMVSTRNRGTEEEPGLVLSLCPGGETVGIVYGYEAAKAAEVLTYLDEREGLGRAHQRAVVPIRVLDATQERLTPSWTYLPILTAKNYDCLIPLERSAGLVAKGRGRIGTSYDYLRLLIGELHKLKVPDRKLNELYDAARQVLAPGAALCD